MKVFLGADHGGFELKNKKGIIHFLPLILICGIIIAVVGMIFYFSRIRACPDEWIVNRMPGPPSIRIFSDNEYFIYQGESRKAYEVDRDWVEKNCNIEPLEVW